MHPDSRTNLRISSITVGLLTKRSVRLHRTRSREICKLLFLFFIFTSPEKRNTNCQVYKNCKELQMKLREQTHGLLMLLMKKAAHARQLLYNISLITIRGGNQTLFCAHYFE